MCRRGPAGAILGSEDYVGGGEAKPGYFEKTSFPYCHQRLNFF